MFKRYEVSKRGPSLFHLFFADDSLIFFNPNVAQSSLLKNILITYEKASGQMISFSKSSIFFIKNTPLDLRVSTCSLLGVV